ncbi:Uncharacterised protein [Streptococcus equi subsp. equi]|nr:Uncharacterised protein [Streptococcus equi subsp. equi]
MNLKVLREEARSILLDIVERSAIKKGNCLS